MKTFYFLITGIFISLSSFSQGTISGEVKNNAQEPLIGATIQVIGKSNGAVTKTDGSFELSKIQPTDRLIFTYIG